LGSPGRAVKGVSFADENFAKRELRRPTQRRRTAAAAATVQKIAAGPFQTAPHLLTTCNSSPERDVRRHWALLVLLLAFVAPAGVFAQSIPSVGDLPTGPRPDSWHIWNGSAVGLNGPVFGDLCKIYRKMPWGEGKTLLTADSHWRLGLHNTISPVFYRPEAMIGVSPLLVLDVDVHYGPEINFTYNRFPSLRSHYLPQNLGPATGNGLIVQHAQANTVFKIGWGPLAVLQLTDLDYFKSNVVYFNWDVATLVKEGFFLRAKTMALVEFMKDWRFFLDYQNFHYFSTSFLSESAGGGFLVMNPGFNHLMVITQINYYIHNPDFRGPTIFAAAVMEWDFPDKK
jgi:hypothetical protein